MATGKKIKTFRFRRGLSRSFSPIPIHAVRTVFVQKSFRHAALQSSIIRRSARFLCTRERVRAARSFIIVIVYRYGSNNIIYYHRTYKILYRARNTHTIDYIIYIYIRTAPYTLGSTSDSGTVRHPVRGPSLQPETPFPNGGDVSRRPKTLRSTGAAVAVDYL